MLLVALILLQATECKINVVHVSRSLIATFNDASLRFKIFVLFIQIFIYTGYKLPIFFLHFLRKETQKEIAY
jgi:hypothetical protein